jgi:hypothetical protein
MRVNRSAEEYVRGEAHTNTVEGFYSIFKRGMKGVYHTLPLEPAQLGSDASKVVDDRRQKIHPPAISRQAPICALRPSI